MPENIDRSGWGMIGLGVCAVAGGALLIFVPGALEQLTSKITEFIAGISFK